MGQGGEGVFKIIIVCDLSVVENFQFYYLFRSI